MKYARKEKVAIIKRAINILKKDNDGMCWAITKAIDSETSTYYPNLMRIEAIHNIFPLFVRKTAVNYFGAIPKRRSDTNSSA